MNNTKIEWTQMTWNPMTGCTKISDGCKNCYAERMAKRLKSMKNSRYENGFEFTMHEDLIEAPYRIPGKKLIFVNSMSDIFHEDADFNFIKRLFDVMNNTKHVYQLLTKRSDILLDCSNNLNWSDNIWMGVTVESKEYLHRIEDLQKASIPNRFISFEPLLSDIPKISLFGIHWIIVGGESGPKSRMIEKKWVSNILEQCQESKIPFFFKQWGGVNKKKNGRLLENKIYNEFPDLLMEYNQQLEQTNLPVTVLEKSRTRAS